MKSFRIVRIAGIGYRGAAQHLYEEISDLASRPFEHQKKLLFEQSFVYSDSFSHAMQSLGHEAYEIIYDVEPLQKKWAEEHGVQVDSLHWKQDILDSHFQYGNAFHKPAL